VPTACPLNLTPGNWEEEERGKQQVINGDAIDGGDRDGGGTQMGTAESDDDGKEVWRRDQSLSWR
jgi:hypothetical protein